MRLVRIISLLTASTIAVGACGGSNDSDPVTAEARRDSVATIPDATTAPSEVTPSVPPHVQPFELPSDPDARFVSLLIGQPHGQTEINDISITVDGRVFFPVESPQGYAPLPASAPQPFIVRQLTEEGLDAVIGFTGMDGLYVESREYGDAGITDQGFTTLTLTTESSSITHRAYALPFETYTDETEANRVVLRSVVEQLLGLRTLDDPSLIGDAVPYEPDAWNVIVSSGFRTDEDPSWPLAEDVAGPCVSIDAGQFPDGVIPGRYVVDGSGAPTDDNPDVVQHEIVEVTPAFPWIEC